MINVSISLIFFPSTTEPTGNSLAYDALAVTGLTRVSEHKTTAGIDGDSTVSAFNAQLIMTWCIVLNRLCGYLPVLTSSISVSNLSLSTVSAMSAGPALDV